MKDLAEDQIKILLYGTGTKEYKVDGENKQGKLTAIWWSLRNFAGT